MISNPNPKIYKKNLIKLLFGKYSLFSDINLTFNSFLHVQYESFNCFVTFLKGIEDEGVSEKHYFRPDPALKSIIVILLIEFCLRLLQAC